MQRAALSDVAEQAQVRTPPSYPVTSAVELEAALGALGLPVMLKADLTWGGLGVCIAHTAADAESARMRLSQRPGAGRALKRLVINRDPFQVLPWFEGATPRVSVQRYVPGRPANSLVACWQGEVLASIQVEVLRTTQTFGASTAVQVCDHAEMAAAATALVRRLGLSGFCGFDFILEDGTDAAHLIELNPRCTPLSHFALGAGRDPVAALTARLSGLDASSPQPTTDNPILVHFPQAWQHEPDSALLRTGYHDVPWEDPSLLRELMRPPYSQRSRLAQLSIKLNRLVAGTFTRPTLPTLTEFPGQTVEVVTEKERVAA